MNEILLEARRRLPAGQRVVQEAFSSDHRRPVFIKLNDARVDTFYFFDVITACALADAMVEVAARQGGGRLTVGFPDAGEFAGQRHRLEHAATRLPVRALTRGRAGKAGDAGIDVRRTNGSVLARFRLVLKEGKPAVLFVAEEVRAKMPRGIRYLGFFTSNSEVVDEIGDDIDLILRGAARRMAAFARLRLLHQTTQQVTRQLESFSRRMELAIRRAHRRPDLLTPKRFDRIVQQSVAKMEQLRQIPLRALRGMERKRP